MAYLLLIALLPFIQLGLSYYASVASLAALLAVAASGRGIIRGLAPNGPVVLLVCAMMFLPAATHLAADSGDLLRTLREAMTFALMALYRPDPTRLGRTINASHILALTLTIATAILLLGLVQAACLDRAFYCGIPQTLFVRNFSTLPDQMDLLYSHLRPTGPFGEASYLAFVMFALMAMVAPAFWGLRIAKLVYALCLATILVSQSALGLAFAMLLSLVLLSQKARLPLTILIGAILATIVLTTGDLATRLSNLTNADAEFSGFVRLYAPLMVLPDFLAQFPFGVPYDKIDMGAYPPGLPVTWAQIVQNGLFNILVSYGLTGLPLLACLAVKFRNNLILALFLAFALVQNGDPFGNDKLAIYFCTISIFAFMRQHARALPDPVRRLAVTPAYP